MPKPSGTHKYEENFSVPERQGPEWLTESTWMPYVKIIISFLVLLYKK